MELAKRGQNEVSEHSFSQNTILNAIDNFIYALEEGITFSLYFRRYEDLYNTDCANWDDFKKVCLLSKLGTVEYTTFGNYILPKKNSN